MNKRIIFFCTIFIWLITGSLFAQNPQELVIGTFISGNLNSNQEIWYSVKVPDTGILTVETTGGTDTYLEAFDTGRNLIKESDDDGADLNAKIDLIITQGATYLFKLKGYEPQESGAFRIFASHRSIPSITELSLGTFRDGNIADGEEYWYTIRAPRNGILTVETTGSTDTALLVLDENNYKIGEDDDSGEEYNARSEIIVRQGKTYFFVLSAYSSAGGPYKIIANIKDLPAPTQLNPGTFLSGNLSSGQNYWYSVRTTANGRLIVGTAGDIDSRLEAFNESLELITSDDDSGENQNAKVEINAEPNRTYLFRLFGWPDTNGSYRIFAEFE